MKYSVQKQKKEVQTDAVLLRLLTKPCVFHLKVKNLGFFFCFDFRFRNFL